MSAARIREIQAELADLGRMQEEGLAMALTRALNEARTVASDDSAARHSVRNEAARLALILEREIIPFSQIMEKGQ